MYSHNVREISSNPATQEPGISDLQASSSGPQELQFGESKEIWIRFLAPCKWTIAEDQTEAETNLAGKIYNIGGAGYERTLYSQPDKSIWILNDVDGVVINALETIKYNY